MRPPRRRPANAPRKPGLAVTRAPGQFLTILLPHGDQIVVTAGEIKGRRMRWHILAPPDVKLLRGELTPRTNAA